MNIGKQEINKTEGASSGHMQQIVSCPTAEQIIKDAGNHINNYECPVCSKDVARIAIVELIYTMEPCDCDNAPYTHLIHRTYHKNCYKIKCLADS